MKKKEANDSTLRFSDRVSDYSRYRPDYPDDAIAFLLEDLQLDSASVIADIGAGTGMLTRHLMCSAAQVVAVEPNPEMRAACDFNLSKYTNYSSVAAPAESTGIDESTVDLITAAQAFHWFNRDHTRLEFQRILKPGGCIALIWNRRVSTQSGFLTDYEALLNTLPEYGRVNHANATDAVISEFLGENMELADFENHQKFNLQGLKGRLLSSSYCPAKGAKGHVELMAELEKLFNKYESEGSVRFDYRTQVYKTHR